MNDLSLPTALNLPIYQRPRVAVLIDADNVPQSALAAIETKACTLGDVAIHRIFADFGLRKDWAIETDNLATHCTSTAGKNRADIHLVISALDIAHRGLATHFLILSDDRDFGPLVAHLRENGMQVEWSGKPKAAAPQKIPAISVPHKVEVLTALDKRLRTLLMTSKTGCNLVRIGNEMKGETVQKQTTKASWRAFFQSKPELYSLVGSGAATVVTWKVN